MATDQARKPNNVVITGDGGVIGLNRKSHSSNALEGSWVRNNQTWPPRGHFPVPLCNHEDGDSSMFVHAEHASLTGNRTITIVTSDTDVVVLAIAMYPDLNINALWLAF